VAYVSEPVDSSGVSSRPPIPEGLLLQVVERLRVMGQVVRMHLIECLAQGEAAPHELAEELGLSQQNVSKHLQVLYRARLVRRRRDGTTVLYSLADDTAIGVLDQMVARVSAQIAELSRLASHEEDEKRGGANPPSVEAEGEES
jgi:DNA-binding transcriptional ArsR family regulator